MGFHTFWDIYNQMRDAVDSELLFESGIGLVDEESRPEDSDANHPPLQDLQPCEFGRNGIPPVQYEGEADCLAFSGKQLDHAATEYDPNACRMLLTFLI